MPVNTMCWLSYNINAAKFQYFISACEENFSIITVKIQMGLKSGKY